ncbi:MAG TPA: hypothetical protein VJI96_01305, partial [Candidatus Andersenbacteria bacterium]|nr:hypothetical protein [Candidatus Andersenbacteria bacterium]
MSALLVRRRPLPIKITPLEGIVLPRADLGLEQRLINAGVRRVDHDFSSRLFTLEAPAGPRKLCLAPCKAFMQDLSWFDKNITSIGFQFALVEDILAFFGSEYRSLREEYDILAPG